MEYQRRAGEAAQAKYANAAAIEYYERLSDLVEDDRPATLLRLGQVLELTGDWEPVVKRQDSWSQGGRGYKQIYSFEVTPAGAGEAVAVFTPTIGVAGDYELFEWHGWHGEDAGDVTEATDVPYTIVHAGGELSGTLDQSQGYGRWNSLGRRCSRRWGRCGRWGACRCSQSNAG